MFERQKDASQTQIDDAFPFSKWKFGDETIGAGASIGDDNVDVL